MHDTMPEHQKPQMMLRSRESYRDEADSTSPSSHCGSLRFPTCCSGVCVFYLPDCVAKMAAMSVNTSYLSAHEGK